MTPLATRHVQGVQTLEAKLISCIETEVLFSAILKLTRTFFDLKVHPLCPADYIKTFSSILAFNNCVKTDVIIRELHNTINNRVIYHKIA